MQSGQEILSSRQLLLGAPSRRRGGAIRSRPASCGRESGPRWRRRRPSSLSSIHGWPWRGPALGPPLELEVGGLEKRTRTARMPQSSSTMPQQWWRNERARVQSVTRARRWRRKHVRELRSRAAMASTRAGARGGRKSAEEGPEALPLWLIWAAGEGSGIEVRLRDLVWPGVACAHRKPNRQIGAEDPGVGKRSVRHGGKGLQLCQVMRGSWAQLIDYTRKNRKGRATWDRLKSRPK